MESDSEGEFTRKKKKKDEPSEAPPQSLDLLDCDREETSIMVEEKYFLLKVSFLRFQTLTNTSAVSAYPLFIGSFNSVLQSSSALTDC